MIQPFKHTFISVIDGIIENIRPDKIIPKKIKLYHRELVCFEHKIDLDSIGKIHVIGVGKAASFQVKAILDRLQDLKLDKIIGTTLAITKTDHSLASASFKQIEASHPVCSKLSLKAAQELLATVEKMEVDDLLLFCLSGGASSLITYPKQELTLEELMQINETLLSSGADIYITNSIRKSLSQIKNGGVARKCKAHRIVNLIISDVPVDDISVIGSSPTFYTPIDQQQTLSYAEKFLSHLPFYCKIQSVIKAVENRPLKNTTVTNIIISNFNKLMEQATQQVNPFFPNNLQCQDKPADTTVEQLVKEQITLLKDNLTNTPCALLSGGEATVKVTKKGGLGGRNTHFVALMAEKLFAENTLNLSDSQLQQILIISVGTDGSDGPTLYAGAWLNYDKYKEGLEQQLNLSTYLQACDTLNYFIKLDCGIQTGATGTNVMDLRMVTFG